MTTRSRKLLASVLLVGVLTAVTGLATWSAFSSTTSNSGNTFASGTVVLTDNDAGGVLFNLSEMDPVDAAVERCIVVTFTGSLPSHVKLYGAAAGGSGLEQYINLTVTRGTIASPSFSSCSGFTADATNHRGLGNGVLFSGKLNTYPTSYATGLEDPQASPMEVWTTSEAHAYRFTVTLDDTDAAQGKTAGHTFTWQARNN